MKDEKQKAIASENRRHGCCRKKRSDNSIFYLEYWTFRTTIRHSIRLKKFWRRDARGPCKQKLFPLLATGGAPGVIQRSRSCGIGRRNGEIHKAATESGVPGFCFTLPRLRDEAAFSYPAYPVHPC